MVKPSDKNIRQQNGICPANDGENVTIYAKPGNKEPALIVDQKTRKVKFVHGILEPEFLNSYIESRVKTELDKTIRSGEWEANIESRSQTIAEASIDYAAYTKIGSIVDCSLDIKLAIKEGDYASGVINLPFKHQRKGTANIFVPANLENVLHIHQVNLSGHGENQAVLFRINLDENIPRDNEGYLKFSFSIKMNYSTQ